MALKALANTIATNSATNVFLATAVHLSNDGTARTIAIANTAAPTAEGANGDYIGGTVSIRIPANGQLVIRKRPNDTVTGAAGCFATKVAEGSEL
jgi:hypothetical protein